MYSLWTLVVRVEEGGDRHWNRLERSVAAISGTMSSVKLFISKDSTVASELALEK